MASALQHQQRVTVSVNGRSFGVFRTRSGGRKTSTPTKGFPGGMEPQEVAPGRAEREDVTLTRMVKLGRDEQLCRDLDAACPAGDIVITSQFLSADRNASGRPFVYRGVLSEVGLPEYDAESDDYGELSITAAVSPDLG